MRDLTEGPLVLALRRGDPAAFEAVYDRYRARIHAFLRRLCQRDVVTDDLFQEVWLRLARNGTRLREDTDLRAWLFTVARNAWVSHRRWTDSRALTVVSTGAVDELASPRSATDDQADAALRVAHLERALASLPGASREVLLLVGVEGFEQEEAAAILGVSYAALRQRLARARKQLAQVLDRNESEEAIA